jgi:hypothetical protein
MSSKVVIGFNIGAHAMALEAASDAEVADAALRALRQVLCASPAVTPQPLPQPYADTGGGAGGTSGLVLSAPQVSACTSHLRACCLLPA